MVTIASSVTTEIASLRAGSVTMTMTVGITAMKIIVTVILGGFDSHKLFKQKSLLTDSHGFCIRQT